MVFFLIRFVYLKPKPGSMPRYLAIVSCGKSWI